MTRTTDPPAPWHEVERAVEAFEFAYARSGRADPTGFCPPPGDPLRLPVAAELVRADLEFAARDGRPRRLDDYRTSFPDLFDDPKTLADVAFEEYRLRSQAGRPASPEEYRDKYGVDTSSWPSYPATLAAGASLGLSSLRTGVLGDSVAFEAHLDDLRAGRFPEPGTEALGFRLVRLLGRGAFGRVYLAEQADLAGRYVALKLSTQLVAEAGTLARLQHTNIVPVYSVHRAGRFQAICMPYLGSTTLADVLATLRDRPTLPLTAESLVLALVDSRAAPELAAGRAQGQAGSIPEASRTGPAPADPLHDLRRRSHLEAALWIASELADGLAHAHARGVIHRDLKPANVLLSDEGRPMLLDFNLAGDARRLGDGAGAIGGTPSHMAPEQLAALAGEPSDVDARSDLYALGLILYELLTGRPAHPVGPGLFHEQVDRLRRARSIAPPPARSLNPAVTPTVDAILARVLAPDPRERYPTAHHLREDLLLHLDHRPLRHVREPSVRERLRKKLRRNPWARSVPFIAGLVAVVAALGLWAYAHRTRQLDVARAAVLLASFHRDAERARPHLILPEPDERDVAAGLALGRRALAAYGVADADRWDEEAAFRDLPLAERVGLRGELGEIAFLLAAFELRRADRSTEPVARRPILDSALRLNAFAAAVLRVDLARGPFVAAQHAQILAADGRHAEAEAIREALPPKDLLGEALWLMVSELDGRREHRKALDLLRQREQERGGSIEYWRALGEHHAALGEWEAAAGAFTTALALSPRDEGDLHGRRGLAYLNANRHPAALADYDTAIRLQPDDPALHRDRAQARLALADLDGALADLDRAAALDPDHSRTYFMRSRVHARRGDRPAAERDRDEGLSRTPADELSWIARGLARRGREPGGAVADLERALDHNPNSRQALQNKASILSEQLGRVDEAIAVLDHLIGLHPEYVPARAGRGVLLARLGRCEAAHADADAALRLSDAPFVRYQVAGIFALTSAEHPEDRARALHLLASAFRDKEGLNLLPTDPDLDPLRDDRDFQRLVEAAKTLESAAASPPP